MKKILSLRLPLILAVITLLMVTAFLRYNLYINTHQLAKEFQTQNAKELYSIDTLKISSRLNSFSKALNWVCIEGNVNSTPFFSMKNGACGSGIFQQKAQIRIPEANNIEVAFTLKLAHEIQILFSLFLFLQLLLIISIIYATQKTEKDKRKKEIEFGELSRQMFHDIRSPLAALNSIAENLKNNNEDYRLLQNSITRINEIANNLLSNNKEGYVELPSFHSIAPLIQEIIEEKKNEYSKRGIEINFQNSSNKSALIVPSEFKRIISNLINNSIEATDLNPKIQIELLQKEDIIKLIIKDNGKGIPEKILQTLGTKAITTKTSGNGLGLKHAYSTIKEWEGSFNVIETNENGTTIEIILRADLVTTAKSESPLIILIDDDALTRATWESKAKKAEIAFQSFKDIPSFKESLSILDKNAVIYIDSELGEIKGETLAKELHEMGFLNLSIASGHPAEKFKEYTFLKSVISKKAPF